MKTLKIHTDGGARGNPGPAAVGVVFDIDEWRDTHSRCLGTATNNVAEYTAVIDALEKIPAIVAEQGMPASVMFYLDSQLVVRQISGQYRVKEPGLQLLNARVLKHIRELGIPCNFEHIPRAQNALADALVNQALDASAA
jgi:ribonuclease HI